MYVYTYIYIDRANVDPRQKPILVAKFPPNHSFLWSCREINESNEIKEA